ncbi:hypothetical protein MMC21_007551 [Puttea exsequens]|nr:hypothetical protein [Puttea exsequens]
MSSDGEVPGIYSPPPHIAARIYRNTASRRKSSAASSRRNSMSSHHSGRSTRSAHGGPQSTHVAQHLRRASIIQDRKDKAANRNAHAEKVRLRAALNKAAPRIVTNSEERALAAQQARERYLAQVKANCAEEVKRSKRVAEEQREKRAAEHLKLKEDMEERHAEAERRKALLQANQRRARTVSLTTGEGRRATTYVWKPRHDVEAATIIQRAWHNRQRRIVIQRFLALGLTVEAVQKTSFEEVGALLAREDVLSCTAKMLKVCGLADIGDEDVAEKTAVRTFLSTFLILGHPAQVLSKEGEQEQDLVSKAKELLLSFNRIIEESPRGSTLTTQLAELTEVYYSFQGAFRAWKAHDSSYLISNMIAQFVALDGIWQTVKDDQDGAVAEDYKEGIQQNQTLVLVRLKRLAGPEKAIRMIKDAIRISRKARKNKESTLDSKPRVAPTSDDTGSIAADLPDVVGPKGRASNQADPSPNAQDPRYPFLRLGASDILPDNRTIIHELMINKEYKIDLEPRIEKRETVIEDVKQALQTSLDAGTGDVWIPAIAELIHDKLLGLFLKPDNLLRVLISETLDPSMIKGQVENGTFSYEKFFSFMGSILPKLCSPARDPEVGELVSNPSQHPIEHLARIYFVVNLLVMDHMNFILMGNAPSILQYSDTWEQREFSKRLAGGSPAKTLRWWKDAAAKASTNESSRRSTDPPSSSPAPIKPQRIYMTGLVDLALAAEALQPEDVPETLELDFDRLTRMRSDTLHLILVASILLTAKNLLRRDVRSLWKNEAQKMWDLPLSSPPASFVSIVESRYALPPTTKQQLTGTITRLLADAREGQANHPVMKVLLRKIQTHVLARLSASSAEERIRTSTTATEVLGSGGMPEFVSRIGDIVQELSKVADVDRSSHGQWYDQIVQNVSEEAGHEA